MTTNITVEHDGEIYNGQIGVIKSTSFGYEDHGILTAMLHIDFGGSGIGVGGYCLDTPAERGNYAAGRRGTAYGLDHIIRIMETVGVDSWEDLPRKQVIVIFEGATLWGGRSIGLASTTTDKVLILAKHAQAWKDAENV